MAQNEFEYSCTECGSSAHQLDVSCRQCGANLAEEIDAEKIDNEFTEFELLLLKNNNSFGTSILLLLAWIAFSDNNIDENEFKDLSFIANKTGHGEDLNLIVFLAKQKDIATIHLASQIIKASLNKEQSALLIQMAIGISLSDGILKNSENIILRFLSDLVEVSTQELNKIFNSLTGFNFPPPEDLSSSKHWMGNGNYKYQSNNSSQRESGDKRMQALSILGLDNNATLNEIKQAYRRLAQIHHPDKFASLGNEAFEAANITFIKISDAYKYLISNA